MSHSRTPAGVVVIAVLALVAAAGCGGGSDKSGAATKGPSTTASPTVGNGKCVDENGKPIGSIDAADLATVVQKFDDLREVPAPIRDDWKALGDGYRQLLAKVGDINLNPPPTDPNTVAAIKALTADPVFSAALGKIGQYCGTIPGG